MKAAFEHVIKKIIESPIIEEPYPHMLISGIFPDEFYSVLLEQIPNTSTYTSKPKYPGRKTMVLDNFDILDEEKKEFWKEVYGFLKSDKFANILLQKFNISKNGISEVNFPENVVKERDTIRGFIFDKDEKDYPEYLFGK